MGLHRRIEREIESLERVIKLVEDGEIGFAEAGDWLHNNGDDILSVLEEAKDLVENLKEEL
jgi:hypothetical protein